MEKYKNILREIKKVFPEVQDVRLIVYTSTQDRIFMEADVKKVLEALDIVGDNFKETQDMNGCAITGSGVEFDFNGKIFVTDVNRTKL